MRKVAAVIGVVTAGLVLAACTSAGSSPAPSAGSSPAPSAGSSPAPSAAASAAASAAVASAGPLLLLDGAWTLTRYQVDGKVAPVPDGTSATAVFAAGKVAGTAGCNSYTGTYTVDGTTLAIGPLATTMMACQPPASDLETAYLANMGKVASFAGSATKLTLSDASGTTLLQYAPTPKGELTGATWTATGVNNGKGGVVTTETTSRITAEFKADGTLSGNATCNTYRGAYTTDGDRITIGPLVTTQMACDTAELNAQEQEYLAALGDVATFSVGGHKLELRDATGALQVLYTNQ
ncbi:MAG: META domain-containing protein [Chloroflexota bacterium]